MKILIASHDAGGAEVLSAWVQANPEHQYEFIVKGPALKIFKLKLEKMDCMSEKPEDSLEGAIDCSRFDLVLTSTSWASDLEKKVIQKAREFSVRVAAYLDHWTNYLERFYLNNLLVLPDEIWVGDLFAEQLAQQVFSGYPVILKFVENQYVKKLQLDAQIFKRQKNTFSQKALLYLCEPIGAHLGTGALSFDEFTLLNQFLSLQSESPEPVVIRVRLHPSEPRDKYKNIIQLFENRLSIYLSSEALLDDCLWADEVVGASSMAMMVAHLIGKKVYTLPLVMGSIYYTLPCEFPEYDIVERI